MSEVQALGPNPLSYEGVSAQNPPTVITALRNPATTDVGYAVGTIWINTSSDTVYNLTSVVNNTASWVALGGGGSAVATITASSGGCLS